MPLENWSSPKTLNLFNCVPSNDFLINSNFIFQFEIMQYEKEEFIYLMLCLMQYLVLNKLQ